VPGRPIIAAPATVTSAHSFTASTARIVPPAPADSPISVPAHDGLNVLQECLSLVDDGGSHALLGKERLGQVQEDDAFATDHGGLPPKNLDSPWKRSGLLEFRRRTMTEPAR
jgi:hypothetical protein